MFLHALTLDLKNKQIAHSKETLEDSKDLLETAHSFDRLESAIK